MNIVEAIVLGAVEGVTEFLPVSSTGHLTIAEKLLGLDIDDKGITGFTAVIQMGAIAAVLIYFAKDIWQMACGVCGGIVSQQRRQTFEYRFGLAVLVGSLPIGIVGFAMQDLIKGPLRNMWWVAGALVVWSIVMTYAEVKSPQERGEGDVTVKDGLMIGLAQCLALVPGVSRSGATISIGMMRNLDRVAATRMSFFLGIPALVGSGVLELGDALSGDSVGVAALIVGTVVSFVVAYASIAWLLKFVSNHPLTWFAAYRVMLGGVLVVLLAANIMPTT